jgi:peptidylprolyl isomerase
MRKSALLLVVLVMAAACRSQGGGSADTAATDLPGEPVSGAVQTTSSGLQYAILQEGSGEKPTAGSTVSVHYTGYLMDGTKFDSSVERGEPIQFVLGQGAVIPGWDEGIGLLGKGAKAKLIIPPELGYGAQGSPPVIPANATLVFDVELVDAR